MKSKKIEYIERADRRTTLGGLWEAVMNLLWVGTESVNKGAESVYRASCYMDHSNQKWFERKVEEADLEAARAMEELKRLSAVK